MTFSEMATEETLEAAQQAEALMDRILQTCSGNPTAVILMALSYSMAHVITDSSETKEMAVFAGGLAALHVNSAVRILNEGDDPAAGVLQ